MSVAWTSRPFLFLFFGAGFKSSRTTQTLFYFFFHRKCMSFAFFFGVTFFFLLPPSVARFAFMRLILDAYLMISKLLFPYRLFLGWRLLVPLLMMMVLLFGRAKHTKNCVSKLFMLFPSCRAAPLPRDAFSVAIFFSLFCLHSAYVGVTLIVAS